MPAWLCVSLTERTYVDVYGVAHETIELTLSTTGSRHPPARWPPSVDLWELLDVDDDGQLCLDLGPLERWWDGPTQVGVAWDGRTEAQDGGRVRDELHALCEPECRAPGAERRWALRALRETLLALRMRERQMALAADRSAARRTALQDQTEALLRDTGRHRRPDHGHPGHPGLPWGGGI